MILRTVDDPEANGRQPCKGDARYTFTFPIEDGSSLQIQMGRESLAKFADFIASMMLDDAGEGA